MHYIRAEHVQWDFAPGGLVDMCTGEPLDSDTSVRVDNLELIFFPLRFKA